MAGGFPSSAFIGRASELQRLEAVLDRAERDQPRVVLLAGDAGVGKTRLLLTFADRARRRGTRVLLGAAVELGDIGLAYLPVVDALRELVDDPEDANLLARKPPMARGTLSRCLPLIRPAAAEIQKASDTGLVAVSTSPSRKGRAITGEAGRAGPEAMAGFGLRDARMDVKPNRMSTTAPTTPRNLGGSRAASPPEPATATAMPGSLPTNAPN
jgi:hypothetical protein